MKKVFNNIKEFMGNKRKRALVSLLFWIIFFVIVITMIGKPPRNYSNNASNKASNISNISGNGINNYKNIKSYEFNVLLDITINSINNKYDIKGTYFDNKQYFIINNKEYYSSNNKVYYVDNSINKLLMINSNNYELYGILDLNILLKDNLYTMVNSSDLDSKTSYKDGTTIIRYNYNTSDSRQVVISTKEKDGLISSIQLDYSKYFINRYQKYIITYELTNHDNILEYNNKYGEYVVEGE